MQVKWNMRAGKTVDGVPSVVLAKRMGPYWCSAICVEGVDLVQTRPRTLSA